MTNRIFDTSELDMYSQHLLEIAQKEMPKETKKFLRKQGQELRKRTRKKAKSKVKKRSGNYNKGIKVGEVYKYKNKETAVRVFAGKPAFHAHLLEYGHIIKREKDDAELGFVPGHHVFEESAKEFKEPFFQAANQFIDEVAKTI